MPWIRAKGLIDRRVVVLTCPEPCWSVGMHYAAFSPVSDHDILVCLNPANRGRDRTDQA